MTRNDGEMIRYCPHHADYRSPLVLTFVFAGAEKWCPYCGWTTGSFFSDHSIQVPATDELVRRGEIYDRASRDYLRAYYRRRKGEEVEPVEWDYGVPAEDLAEAAGLESAPRMTVTCDGCGKEATVSAEVRGRRPLKPAHWYSRSDEDGRQLACSRACISKVAEATGKTRVISPI